MNYIDGLGDTSRWITPLAMARPGWDGFAREVRDHKFVLSPLGHGLDCHRTWETLLLGGIPVVKSGTLDSLYDGLPVVILDDWTELTESRLLQEWDRIGKAEFHLDRAFFPYWKRLILAEQEESAHGE